MDTFNALLGIINRINASDSQGLLEPCRQILAQLESLPSNTINFGLRAIASDLVVRLESNGQNLWNTRHMSALNDRMEAIRADLHGITRQSFWNTPNDTNGRLDEIHCPSPENSDSYDPLSERYILLRDFLLDGLAFTAMTDREEQVAEAYNETFDWIYRDDSHSFSTWLRNDAVSPMYWISGLPGSGKSTLMRYISEQRKTTELLRAWAGNKATTLASFFFWESGTTVQRSQAGLLRSLLYQLLKAQPELIPTTFPDLWKSMWTADARTRIQLTSNWSIPDLSNAFLRFFALTRGRHICLLVDGLDEFEGDHQMMIDLLERACQRPQTKICVSSRPWNVFEKAFRNVPAMRLQDLTANDMVRFILGNMNEYRPFCLLMENQQQAATRLIDAIVARAEGVFLWVSLAIRVIIERYQTHQDLSHVRHLVESLPRSLDDLFHHLLLDTNIDFRSQMSRIFQLIHAREVVCEFTRDDDANSLYVWEMVLTDDDIAGLNPSSPIQEVACSQVNDLCRKTIANISKHCAGLVEVHQSRAEKRRTVQLQNSSNNPFLPRRKIMYLHRTIKDYLKRDDVWTDVVSYLPGIDPHLLHVQASIYQLRFPLDTPRVQRNINEWWSRIVLTMTHARYALPGSRQAVFDHLNAFDDILNWYWPPRSGSVAVDSWARSCFGTYETRGSTRYPDPFLSLATKFGVAGYLKTYLDTYEYGYEQEKPLLSYAVQYLIHRQNSVYPLSDPQIVDALFKNGENPNLIRQPERDLIDSTDGAQSDEEHSVSLDKKKPPPKLKTPWVVALEAVQQAHRRGWIDVYDVNPEGTARWARILRIFLQNGANPNVEVEATYKDKKETALELIIRLFDTYRAKEIQLVRDLLLTKLQTSNA